MYAYNFLSGAIGMSGATPRIRKSIRTLAPTNRPMPMQCQDRMNQYAKSESASRIQTLIPLASIALKISNNLRLLIKPAQDLQTEDFMPFPIFGPDDFRSTLCASQ